MSLEDDGVWKGGLWSPTVWADEVWRVGVAVDPPIAINPKNIIRVRRVSSSVSVARTTRTINIKRKSKTVTVV